MNTQYIRRRLSAAVGWNHHSFVAAIVASYTRCWRHFRYRFGRAALFFDGQT